MEETSSPKVLKFQPASEQPYNGNNSDFDLLAPPDSDEKTFNRILELERKRSERSKRPFMLMLLSLDRLTGAENVDNIHASIFSCLNSAKRDIDVLGWYKHNSIAGMIFTEILDPQDGSVAETIVERVKTSLALNLGADEIKKIVIDIYFFPEKLAPEGSPSRLTLYPDIKKRLGAHRSSLIVKRIVDLFCSLVGLVLGAPIFAAIAALIKLDSKGPVFFRQARVGQYGKTFTFLKFRSMYADNDPSIHREYVKKLICSSGDSARNGDSKKKDEIFKIQNDPRVTAVGRFLRQTSLDELPQLINVLRGDMSLVGPRPPIPYELENYDLWHRRRVLEMKPGITGVWQVEGRSRTTFNEMVRMDINYVTHWSLWLDFKLLLKTPLAVFSSKGAY
jgi:lipopolysaccharide/colanic/teichoic acid biosynthesis glycosyltransferase